MPLPLPFGRGSVACGWCMSRRFNARTVYFVYNSSPVYPRCRASFVKVQWRAQRCTWRRYTRRGPSGVSSRSSMNGARRRQQSSFALLFAYAWLSFQFLFVCVSLSPLPLPLTPRASPSVFSGTLVGCACWGIGPKPPTLLHISHWTVARFGQRRRIMPRVRRVRIMRMHRPRPQQRGHPAEMHMAAQTMRTKTRKHRYSRGN
jgi:hypothetical protein